MIWVELLGLWFVLGIGVAALLHITRWPDLDDDDREYVVRARRDLR